MTLVLAADIGGTRAKAALFDAEGAAVAEAALPSPPGEGTLDDPTVLLATLEALLATLPDAPIGAVAITAFARTQVFLDVAGKPVAPSIGFRDTRAAEAAEQVVLADGAGDGAPVSAFHPLARLAWLRQHAPAARERLAWMLAPKDAINLWLTGVAAMDPPSNAALKGVTHRALPPRRAPTDALGLARAGLPGALARLGGARVYVSAMDAWCGARGMGAVAAGDAYAILGTSGVVGLLATAGRPVGGVLCVDWGDGLLHLGGPTQAGADAVVWLLALAGKRPEQAEALLTQVGPAPPLFLPHLQGERTPFWNPELRGAFLRLDRAHGLPDLLFAVAEGVAFQLRAVLAAAEDAGDATADRLLLAGGGAGDGWARILADVLDRPVHRCALPEPALRGAAHLALGRVPPPPEATEFAPDAARVAWHATRLPAWQGAIAALAALP